MKHKYITRIMTQLVFLSICMCSACTPTSEKNKEKLNSDAPNSKGNETNGASILTKSPNERLIELVGHWNAIENSFINEEQKFRGEMVGFYAADSTALYTTYKQGSGESYYEANAIWGYSESTKQVRVFEINNIGVMDTHVGYFDPTGSLIIELRDPVTNDPLQKRIINWDKDTLKMKALFISKDEKTEHTLILTRQKD